MVIAIDSSIGTARLGKKKPLLIRNKYNFLSAINLLFSLAPWARPWARHFYNYFETGKFFGKWKVFRWILIALFCWLCGMCSQFRNGYPQAGLPLSFESPVALSSTVVANLLLCCLILSTSGNFTCSIKGYHMLSCKGVMGVTARQPWHVIKICPD